MLRRLLIAALAALACAALPASALGQSKILQDYRKDGTINPCAYSPGELKKGLSGLPPDVEAYVPGLSDQLRRSCNTGAAPVVQQQTSPGVFAPISGGGPPSAPQIRVPKPPGPGKVSTPEAIAGTAPSVSKSPVPDIPGWLAGLLAALIAGVIATLLGARYGLLDLSRVGRRFRTGSVGLGDRIADAFAGLGDRLRLR